MLADILDNTEKDIIRALNYWAKIGLITITCDASNCICGIALEHVAALTETSSAADTIPADKPSVLEASALEPSALNPSSAKAASRKAPVSKCQTVPGRVKTDPLHHRAVSRKDFNTHRSGHDYLFL